MLVYFITIPFAVNKSQCNTSEGWVYDEVSDCFFPQYYYVLDILQMINLCI